MTLVVVPCPVCESRTFEPLYPGTVVDGAAGTSHHFGSSRSDAGHLAIVRCERCGLVMSNPQDDGDTLAAVYAAQEDEVYERESENRRQSALRHLRLIGAHRPGPGRLLDVGCASGIFASTASEKGWTVTGIEPSDWMIARARARCPGATFIASRFDDLAFPAGAFDVITLWDVLEHLPAPLKTLERAREWLAPDGLLVLSVPNAGSLCARLLGRRWVLLLREHLWYFSPQTMAGLLSAAGFTLVRTRTKLVRFSLASICGRLAQYSGAHESLTTRLSRATALRRVSVSFPMGEMDVVARVVRN